MRMVHELFQFVGSSKARRRREKTRDLITERSVVRVLLNRHQLDSIVTGIGNTRQDVLRELSVRPYMRTLLRHSNVRFVNNRRASRNAIIGMLPHVWFFW